MSDYVFQIQEAENKALEIIEEANKAAVVEMQKAKEAELAHVAHLFEIDRESAQDRLDKAKEETAQVYNQAYSAYSSKIQSLVSGAESKKKTIVDQCVTLVTHFFA